MNIEEIRKVVSDTIASIAPNFDGRLIESDHPLREQIDLDSMDWLNVLENLQDRLKVDIPESDHVRLTTLESIAVYLASRLAEHPVGAPQSKADVFAALPRIVTLRDDSMVTLRPVRTEDAPLEADFVRRLSTESRYKRFMATMRELPQAKLKYLTEVDGVHHVALAATMCDKGQETPVGVARYVVGATGTDCEFAVSVDDAWQGSGLAGVLMHTLMDVARARA